MCITLAKENLFSYRKSIENDNTSPKILLLTNKNFTTSANNISQLSSVILHAKNPRDANMQHYTSMKPKGLTRSVLAAEEFAPVMEIYYSTNLEVR